MTQLTVAQQREQQQKTALAVKKEQHEIVMSKIKVLEEEQGLKFPPNYSYANAVQSAWLSLQDLEDRSGNKALAVCTPTSIANFMLNLVTQGLSVTKKQCYPICMGKELTLMRSYFGEVAIVKRLPGVKSIYAQVIRKDQPFKMGQLKTDTSTLIYIEDHDIQFETLDNDILGAYCIIVTDSGTHTEIMTKKQIDVSWSKTKMKNNTVQKEFPEEMSKRTVIKRAAKMFINSSDDSDLMVESYNKTLEDEYIKPAPEDQSNQIVSEKVNQKLLEVEDGELVDDIEQPTETGVNETSGDEEDSASEEAGF